MKAHGQQVVFVKNSNEKSSHVLMKAELGTLLLPPLNRNVESVPLCASIIRERIAYRKASRNGMGITELDPPEKDAKAITELTALYEEIFNG